MKGDLLYNLFPNSFNISGFNIHSCHTRTIQKLPISEYGVTLKFPLRRFQRLNPRCDKNYFVETFPGFISSKKRWRNRLTNSILNMALYQASEQCSLELQQHHTKISGDTILKIFRDKQINIYYDQVTKIAIDDFAFKKKKIWNSNYQFRNTSYY